MLVRLVGWLKWQKAKMVKGGTFESPNRCCGHEGFYFVGPIQIHYDMPKFGAPGRMIFLLGSVCPNCNKRWDQRFMVPFDPYETVESRELFARFDREHPEFAGKVLK